MLVVGMNGISDIEARTHFSLWSIAANPLWIGINVTSMSETTK